MMSTWKGLWSGNVLPEHNMEDQQGETDLK